MKTLTQFKKEALKRPGVRKVYAELQPEISIIRDLIFHRTQKKLTQRELAKKIGIAQSALARFESGSVNPNLDFVIKVSTGLGLKLMVK